MPKQSILIFIKRLKRPVFTTYEVSSVSGKSLSSVTQSLNYLEKQGLIFKIYRGIWAEAESKNLSPYSIIHLLFPLQKVYVSFISALHLYDIIEQIPQTITLASTAHTRTIHTKIATYTVHHIVPSFFKGFGWYKKENSFLIAEPEKALVDCLYLSAYKKKQFGHFPELYLPKTLSIKKINNWISMINNPKVRLYIRKRIHIILKNSVKQ